MQYEHDQQSMYAITYSLLFCAKRKKQVLVGPIRDRLEQLIQEVVKEYGWDIHELNISPDCVALSVRGHPYLAPAELVRLIKWRSAHTLRGEFPELKRLPSLWTRSALYSTERKIGSEIAQQYIEQQSKI